MRNALQTKPLIPSEILSIFQEIKHQLSPSYRYLQGNCHSLAHLSSLILKKHGISHKKIWVFAPCRYFENSNEVFIISDPNQIAPKGYIRWGYHVAPLLELPNHELIFDFSFSDTTPLDRKEWLAHLPASRHKCVVESPEMFLFYSTPSVKKEGAHLFNGNFYPIEGNCLTNRWFEKGLAANETALLMHEEVIKRAIERNASTHMINDYRHLIGSINNFECVFRDKGFNKKMTPHFQHKHRDVINYYQGVFDDNVEKWSALINEL